MPGRVCFIKPTRERRRSHEGTHEVSPPRPSSQPSCGSAFDPALVGGRRESVPWESTDCERRDRLGKAAPLIAEALEQCNGSPACVDLADVTFLDSTGIAVLVAANKRASERATEFTIRNAAPNVRRVFEITGLDDLLAFEPN